ncbi:uncharacterized protein [Venturia canescens]|uniref:uncharacterized protein n=1 Tax=Venturia canescens TaxID=32260 RepID=UPI001C9C6782|nr:uncharacterized protein LOC122408813 [Venturia canescens]
MAGKNFRTRNSTSNQNLQDQIEMLTSEVERLKAIMEQHGLNHLVSPDCRVPDPQIARRLFARSSPEENSEPAERSPVTPRRKGCTCKGNCSSRICGCVKKQVQCGEFCRCADELCQNQEQEKENRGSKNNQKAPALVEEKNKKTKKAERGKSKKQGTKNQTPMNEKQIEVNELLEEVAHNIHLAVQEEMHIDHQNGNKLSDSVKDSEAEPETHSAENIESIDAIIIKTDPEESEQISNNNPRSDLSSPDHLSPSYSVSYNHLLPIDDPNFDPMKPRHKLARSPVTPHIESQVYPPPDASEESLAPPRDEVAEELSPPDDLNSITIDWDKHQKERVYCTKCHRGFYPYRIKKHEASCKRV